MNINLSIEFEFPWFRKWEMEFIFYADPSQWCWFKRRFAVGNTGDTDLGIELDLMDCKYLSCGFEFLCFDFCLEGAKEL